MTKKILLLISFLILSLVICNICLAADMATIGAADLTTIGATEPTDFHVGDWYISETDLVINEKVDGNVFAIGNTVTVNSEINGDLFALTNNLIISENAKINGNLFAISTNISNSGTIDGDVYNISQETTLKEKSNIGRSLNSITQNFYIDGIINRNANLLVENFAIPNTAKTLINGDLNYSSSTKVELDENNVKGTTNYTAIVKEDSQKQNIKVYISSLVRTLFFTLVIFGLTYWLFPEFIDKAAYIVSKKPLPVFFSGLGTLILLPILMLVLIFTGLATSIGFILLFVYIIAIILAFAVLSIALGKVIANSLKHAKTSDVLFFSLLSSLVLWLLKLIPIVGGYISAFTLIVGLGILTYNLFNRKLEIKKEND